jgi:hypothetical protein
MASGAMGELPDSLQVAPGLYYSQKPHHCLAVSAASLVVGMGAGLAAAMLGMLCPGLSWQKNKNKTKNSSLLPDILPLHGS